MSFADWADAPTPDVLERIVVVSPHFDDAVQGAGLLLARHPGSTVVTVFGGPPPTYPDPPSEWDALGGFARGDDVVALRRVEDASALAMLQATPHWLGFTDHQYVPADHRASAADVAAALRRDHLLDERLDANLGEQHWRIARPPAGWEGLTDLPG